MEYVAFWLLQLLLPCKPVCLALPSQTWPCQRALCGSALKKKTSWALQALCPTGGCSGGSLQGILQGRLRLRSLRWGLGQDWGVCWPGSPDGGQDWVGTHNRLVILVSMRELVAKKTKNWLDMWKVHEYKSDHETGYPAIYPCDACAHHGCHEPEQTPAGQSMATLNGF